MEITFAALKNWGQLGPAPWISALWSWYALKTFPWC